MTPRYFVDLLEWHREQVEARRLAANQRAGVIAATVANSQGGISDVPGGKARPAMPWDFFPDVRPKRQEGEDEMTFGQVIQAFKRMGAVDLREKED